MGERGLQGGGEREEEEEREREGERERRRRRERGREGGGEREEEERERGSLRCTISRALIMLMGCASSRDPLKEELLICTSALKHRVKCPIYTTGTGKH